MGAIIDVKFTANTGGTPGTWNFSPPAVTLEPGHPRSAQYQLTSNSTPGWFFHSIAIGENAPNETDLIEANSASFMEFGGLLVHVTEFKPEVIMISFDGILPKDMTTGVILTVSNGTERHTCRDPQIVLKRDP